MAAVQLNYDFMVCIHPCRKTFLNQRSRCCIAVRLTVLHVRVCVENTDKDCCRARGLPDGCGPNPDTNVPCNYLDEICCGDFCKLPACGCNTGTTCSDSGRVSAPCPAVNPYDPSPSDQACKDCTDDAVCCVPGDVPIDSDGCLWGAWLVGFYLVTCWPGALAFLITGCCRTARGAKSNDWCLGLCSFVSCMIALAVVLMRAWLIWQATPGVAR
jgi:hypothetical protein